MRNRTIALSAAVLATALALPAAGHSETQPQGPPVEPGRPGTEEPAAPDESGCRNVLGGFVGYQQLVQSIAQEEFAPRSAALGMYKSRVVTTRNKGVATAGVELAAPSCPDVLYTIKVYTKTGQLLASHTQPGDGISGTKDSPLILEAVVANHAVRSIGIRVFTESTGVVHDVAPDDTDDPAGAIASPDGLPPGSGGANSSFK